MLEDISREGVRVDTRVPSPFVNQKRSSFWQAEQVAFLRELFEAGTSASNCALAIHERFGVTVTRNAVIGVCHRNGLRRGRKASTTKTARRSGSRLTKRVGVGREGVVIVNAVTFNFPDPSEAKPRHISLDDLQQSDCRYVYGEGPFTFCGDAVHTGSPYCPAHHGLCYRPYVQQKQNAEAV